MRRTVLTLLAFVLAVLPLKAQFYLAGDDPGHLRWNTIETPHYQLIYPVGADSLARTYGRLLEQFRVPMGRSYGIAPGEGQRRKMPVVLHAFHPYSNGSVGWAPSRMDLYTMPETDGADPEPWALQLASHEPRHQAQFQQGSRKYFRLFNVLSGEIWNPLTYQTFLGLSLGEGDAVSAEAGLWKASRARTADFLNYYQVALDQGDYRNWFRWRYGSYKHLTPDYYTVGYLAVAGARYLTGNPFIMQETADNGRRKPWLLSSAFRSTVKKNTGGQPYNATFRAILDTVNAHWRAEAEARAPFQPMEQISRSESFPVDYSSAQMADDGTLYVLRKGSLHPAELVAIRDGKVKHLMDFASTEMSLFYEGNKNRIYWAEKRLDARWKLAGASAVCYYDIASGKPRELVTGHYYYNPQPSPDGRLLAVCELLPSGENHVTLLSTEDGSAVRRTRVPDGIQASEFAWLESTVYLSGISAGGYGIYRITPEGVWEEVLAPSIQKVVNMGNGDGCVEWVSDRTGVNEYYQYYPAGNRLLQVTSTRYGCTDPASDDRFLYTAAQTLGGMMLYRTPLDSLRPREVSYADVHSYFLADKLREQEQALGPLPDLSSAVPMSAPKRYYKFLHPLRLHSWLPFYVNYDAVKEGSMDFSYETASLGLSGFFQNTLGTVSGMVGYGLHRSPDNPENWRNAFHARLVYTGLFPVFEASVDVGDRRARQYFLNAYDQTLIVNRTMGSFLRKDPFVEASIRAYIPLSFKRFGVNYGFVPQFGYTFSNNSLATDPVVWKLSRFPQGMKTRWRLSGETGTDARVFTQRLKASVRGYAILSKGDSQIYPRLGIGAEVGASLRPGLTREFTPNLYAYVYGYLPGLWRTQGLRLTGMVQQQIRPSGPYFGELSANTLPRGFAPEAGPAFAQAHPFQWKLTADYAIPIYVGDINIPGIAYIKNFVLTPHGDFTGFSGGNLWSAGADFTAEMAKLILPFDASLGVSLSYLGGSWYKNTDQEKPWSVELILGMDF